MLHSRDHGKSGEAKCGQQKYYLANGDLEDLCSTRKLWVKAPFRNLQVGKRN